MSKKNPYPSILGFSLLEMMIALSISVILLFLALSTLSHLRFHVEADILQTQLFQAMQFAQEEAALNRQAVGLCGSHDQRHCSQGWTEGYLIFIDTHKDGIIYTAEQILFSAHSSFSGRLYWRSFPLYRDYLLFLPSFSQGSNNGTFWYCSLERLTPSWALVINKSGRVRVVEPNKQGEIIDFTGKVLQC